MKLPWVLFSIAALVGSGPGTIQASPAAAQTRTAPENPPLKLRGLISLCQRSDPASTAACGAYITGVAQGSQATQADAVAKAVTDGVRRGAVAATDAAIETASKRLREQSNLFCLPSDWTAGDVQSAVLQYGRERADVLDEMSAIHVLRVLAKAFPCGVGK